MKHLEDKARADGITVPLTGNNNGTFNSGVGALDVDGPDAYPQGFNCSHPSKWNGVPDSQLRPPGGQAAVLAGVPGRRVRPVGRPRLRQAARS